MSYRFTNTEKWGDAWFSSLKQIEMLLFIYLCDNCDIAGFVENIEVNKAIYARCAGTNQRVFAAWANEAIYFDRESLKFWMKLKEVTNENGRIKI